MLNSAFQVQIVKWNDYWTYIKSNNIEIPLKYITSLMWGWFFSLTAPKKRACSCNNIGLFHYPGFYFQWWIGEGERQKWQSQSNDICLPSEPEKNSHFWAFIAQRVLHRFEWFKFHPKDRDLFCDFSRCLTSIRRIGKFNLLKISWL